MLNTKEHNVKNVINQTVDGPHWLSQYGEKYYGSQWDPSTVWLL